MSRKTPLVHLTKRNGHRLVLNPHHIAGMFDCSTGCWVVLVGCGDEGAIQLSEPYETALAVWYSALSE